MRILPLLALAALTSAASAQNIEIWTSTQFTSRGSIGSGTGETLQGFHSSHWLAIGDVGTRCEIKRLDAVMQDQNQNTQEPYFVSFRTGTDVTGPLAGTGPQTQVGSGPNTPFMSPPPIPNSTIRAFNIVHNFSPSVQVPCNGHWSVGIELSPAPAWTADGLSSHMMAGDGNNMQTLQKARLGAPGHAWQIIGAAGNAVRTASPRTWRYEIFTDTPTLQMGNGGSNWAMGGLFPDVGVPLSARVRGGSAMGGAATTVYLLVGAVRLPVGFPIFSGTRLWTGFAVPVPVGAGTASAAGESVITITQSVPAGVFPPLPFVALQTPTNGPTTMSNFAYVEGL